MFFLPTQEDIWLLATRTDRDKLVAIPIDKDGKPDPSADTIDIYVSGDDRKYTHKYYQAGGDGKELYATDTYKDDNLRTFYAGGDGTPIVGAGGTAAPPVKEIDVKASVAAAGGTVGFLKNLGLNPNGFTEKELDEASDKALKDYQSSAAFKTDPEEQARRTSTLFELKKNFPNYSSDGKLTAGSLAKALDVQEGQAADGNTVGGVGGNPPEDGNSLASLVANTGTSVFNNVIIPNSDAAEHKNSGENVHYPQRIGSGH